MISYTTDGARALPVTRRRNWHRAIVWIALVSGSAAVSLACILVVLTAGWPAHLAAVAMLVVPGWLLVRVHVRRRGGAA